MAFCQNKFNRAAAEALSHFRDTLAVEHAVVVMPHRLGWYYPVLVWRDPTLGIDHDPQSEFFSAKIQPDGVAPDPCVIRIYRGVTVPIARRRDWIALGEPSATWTHFSGHLGWRGHPLIELTTTLDERDVATDWLAHSLVRVFRAQDGPKSPFPLRVPWRHALLPGFSAFAWSDAGWEIVHPLNKSPDQAQYQGNALRSKGQDLTFCADPPIRRIPG